MPTPESQRNTVTIMFNSDTKAIDIVCNHSNQWDNLMTCALAIGLLYNRCVESGYSEDKVYDSMLITLMGAITTFRLKGYGGNEGNTDL